MRDGTTRRRTTTQHTTWAPERVQVDHWRRKVRPHVLRAIADQTTGLALSRRLLNALLDELHISDDFDVLVGRVARLPASQYPRLLAIALLLRHSWCPQDLARTARRLGLSSAVASTEACLAPESLTTRDRGHRHRERTSASPSEPRTSHR